MQIEQQMQSAAVKRAAAGQLPCGGAVHCPERESERESGGKITLTDDDWRRRKKEREKIIKGGGGGTFRNYEWVVQEGGLVGREGGGRHIMDAVTHCGASGAEINNKWPLQALPVREPIRREENHNLTLTLNHF